MPNYNSSEFLSETLNSIFNQNFENWNLIIIDDNSDEKTKDILKKINNDKVKIIWLKKNKGQGFCRNLALRYYCKSDYVSFIDSDDLWKKSKLKEQINFMRENDIDFSYTPYEIVESGNNKFVKNIMRLLGNFSGNSYAHWGHALSVPLVNLAPFIKNMILKDVGLNISNNYMNTPCKKY